MIGQWALVEGGHLNTDSSVSLSLVTFLVSAEIIYCAASLGFGGRGVCVGCSGRKKGLNLPFLKATLGLVHFFFPSNFQNRI